MLKDAVVQGRVGVWLLVLAALAISTYALWLPFGWNVPGTFEEWGIMQGVDERGVLAFLYIPSSHRPLYMAPWALAQWLTPGSFLGLNVIQALLLFGKAAAMFWLVSRLFPGTRAVAFVSAALLLVYPADDASYTLRTTNLHAGAFFLLVSLCLLSAADENFRWPVVVAMMVMQALSLATYDGGMLLMICGPVILIWMHRRFTRRLAQLALIWWAVPAFFVIQLVRAVRNPDSYQTLLIRLSGLDVDRLGVARIWAASTVRALTRTFWSAWKDALALPTFDDPYVRIAATLTFLVFVPVALLLTLEKPRPAQASLTRNSWMLVVIGAGAVVAGFAMYLPTTWRNTNWRVLIYSSIGAALAVGIACWIGASLFRRWSGAVFVVLSGTLFLAAAAHALGQHDYYYGFGQRQQTVLSRIVNAAPRVATKTDLLLIDKTPEAMFEAWSMCTVVSDCLQTQLRYIYKRSDLRAAYCAPGFRPRGESSEICRFGADGVTVSYAHLESKQEVQIFFPYGSLVVLENTSDGVRLLGNLDEYAPRAGDNEYRIDERVDQRGLPPSRVHSVFARWPFRPVNPRKRLSASYRFEFDRPAPGRGWSGPEGSLTWTNAVESTLDLWLQPGSDYDVRFRILRAIAPDVLASLRMTVNGKPVALVASADADGATILVGSIPAVAVDADRENTQLAFRVDRVLTPKSLGMNDDERTLGLRFDWIEIHRHSVP